MSSLEENAFQIARYLLENPHQDGQIEIRDALGFSSQDFLIALKFLVDAECCHTAGQFGTGIVRDKNLARLQDFVNRLGKGRGIFSTSAEKTLIFLFDNKMSVSDAKTIMTNFHWDKEQFSQVYDILKTEDLVDARYADDEPFEIWITDKGKKLVRNNFCMPMPPTHIIYAGNNNIINIDSTLTSVSQVVQASYISLPEKQEIETLLRQLSEALNDAPPEKREDAEAIAEIAKNLIENAIKEQPNKSIIKISAEGLIKAAENLGKIVPQVLLIAQSIISFVMELSKYR